MKRIGGLWGLLAVAMPPLATAFDGMVLLPAGSYTPLYLARSTTGEVKREPVAVAAFWLERTPVTRSMYEAFLKTHPAWSKAATKAVFADAGYLGQDADAASGEEAPADSPMVNVSWFAATAYCEARAARLPTTDEWEYALADQGRDAEGIRQRSLMWYSVPQQRLSAVGGQPPNGFGISDLIGLVWEWTADFNSYLAAADSRDKGSKDLFCGAGSEGTSGSADYAAFMRYAYRGSVQGAFTGKNLGFRCARDVK